tara:strand:- start:635 stop:1243 length:609 start_codon:yes stop_codon:yes gene_type:complete
MDNRNNNSINDMENGSFKIIYNNDSKEISEKNSVSKESDISQKENVIVECFKRCCVGSAGCLILLFTLALAGCSVTYYVYCIMALVKDSHDSIQNTCSKSNIWTFLLTVLILNIVSLKGVSSSGSKDNGMAIFNIFIGIIIIISICTWGSLEYWNECVQDKLSNTLIFTMVQITLIIEYAVIGILTIFIILLWRKLWSESKK